MKTSEKIQEAISTVESVVNMMDEAAAPTNYEDAFLAGLWQARDIALKNEEDKMWGGRLPQFDTAPIIPCGGTGSE